VNILGKPTIVHQGGTDTSFPAHFANGLPPDWGVHATQSGYMDKAGFRIVADHFVRDFEPTKENPHFWYIDGHDSHWDLKTIKWLQGQHVYVLFLKANDSINDQPNDNGPNASLREKYNVRVNEWRASHPGVKYDPMFFNQVIALAWQDFVDDPNTKELIIEAFRKTRIHPLVDVCDKETAQTFDDKRNAKLASLFSTDAADQSTLRVFTDQEIATAAVSDQYNFHRYF
jgi:hypothetical protein